MLIFRETKMATENFYAATKTINIQDVSVGNIVISRLAKTKTSSSCFSGYLDKAIRPLVLIIFKMSRYVKTFKVKDGDKDESNKLLSFRIDHKKLLEKYKIIWTKIEDLNVELNTFPAYNVDITKTK